MVTASGTLDLSAYGGGVYATTLSGSVFIVQPAYLSANVSGEPALDLSAMVQTYHISDLMASAGGHLPADLTASVDIIYSWDLNAYTLPRAQPLLDLTASVSYHNVSSVSGSVVSVAPDTTLTASVRSYATTDLPSSIASWDQLDLTASGYGWAVDDLPASMQTYHESFLTASGVVTTATTTVYDPDLGYIRDVTAKVAGTGGYSDLNVSYTIDYKIFDLAGEVHITGESTLSGIVNVWTLDKTADFPVLVSFYHLNNITAAVSGTGGFQDLTAQVETRTLTSDLTASVYANVAYVTTVFPINTVMHHDISATIGIMCCEGGSSFSNLPVIYTRNFTLDLTAQVISDRDPSVFDLTAEVNTSVVVLGIMSIEVVPEYITSRANAKAVDALSIRVIPDRFAELTASVSVQGPRTDLPVSVVAVRPPIYRRSRLYFDGSTTPMQAKLEEGFVSEIEYRDLKNPKIHKTIKFRFAGGDREFFYRSLSQTVSRLSEKRWKIEAVSFEDGSDLSDIKNKKTIYVDHIDGYTTVDEAIRDVIEKVAGSISSDITAQVSVIGVVVNLSASVVSTPEDRVANLSGSVYLVESLPDIGASVVVIP